MSSATAEAAVRRAVAVAEGLAPTITTLGAWLAAQGMALTWRGGGNPAEA